MRVSFLSLSILRCCLLTCVILSAMAAEPSTMPHMAINSALTTRQQIQQLYIAYLGRAADVDGLNYWTQQVADGAITLDQIRTNLVNEQPEYLANYGQLSDPELTDKVYINLFNREADAAGREYWVEQLAQGNITQDQLIIAFINGSSVSDKVVVANKLFIAECYTDGLAAYTSADVTVLLTSANASQTLTDCPPVVAEELVFAVIGDFGDTLLLAEEPDTLAVANLIKSWQPAFILTVGDNDYSDGRYAMEAGDARFTGLELGVGQFFHDYIGNYKGNSGAGGSTNRFFPVPGDHDYGDDCDNPRLGPYLDYFTLPVGPVDETYYQYRFGDTEIFAIDSIEDCHLDNGAKMMAQKTWLQAAAQASDAAFKIVILHNPPYSSGARHGSAEHVQWEFADWGIDLVIAGDDHIYERIQRDGVTYIVNGLGGVEIHPDFITPPVEGSQQRYNLQFGALRVAGNAARLNVSFISVDGVVQDQFSLYSGDWYQPASSDTWQWQLQGTINTSYDVAVYDVDLFETPPTVIDALHSAGKRVICYFSAGSYEDFRDDASQFLASDLGNTLDGFADERWLDIRSSNIRQIMQERMDVAVSKGCDGVEPDNMDAWDPDNNAGFAEDPLTAADQLEYNRFIATEAHTRGLAVGLKNDLPQIPELVDYFDFAVNEQCHQFDECATLQPFTDADKPVFNAEYPEEKLLSIEQRNAVCAAAIAAGIHTLILPLDLDDSSRDSCDEMLAF